MSHVILQTSKRQQGQRVVFNVLLCIVPFLWLAQGVVAQTLTRGPYLQQGTPTSLVVRWRTNAASTSRVQYGPAPTQLTGLVDDPTSTTEHSVTLPGLTPNTQYYYAVGTPATTLAGGDANHFFWTAPPPGAAQSTRIWALGDSGTANANAAAVRNAYLDFTGSQYTDVWLMLGDNAYEDGTDSEYQNAVFDMYPATLRQSVLWSTLANHDGHSADSSTQTGPYYDIFTLPTNGEAGGMASGTEAYYAFDYANIHFVVLDSYETNRAADGAMMTWLESDLAQNTLPWVIGVWHHPPYTKGSHNSDTETELVQMRQNSLPILEAAGVDLVLSGHSHSYERSFLIDGHYGTSGTFNASMQVDAGDGRVNGDGEYEKPADDSHDGAVYIVAGSSGKTSGGSLNHPAMFVSINLLGSVVIDVNANIMDVLFLDNNGVSQDHFSIIKGAAQPTVTVAATDATATEALVTPGTFTVTRSGETTASLAVPYSTAGTATAGSDYTALTGLVTIASGATTATITVSPIDDTLSENNETVQLTLTADAAYTVGTPNSATVTIISDEDPPPTVTMAASDATATEAGLTTGTFTASRTGSTTAALTVLYTVSGTATPGSDYTALTSPVTIPIGAASATILVTPLDDPTVEAAETVLVTLAAAAAYTVGTPSSATVTLSSDDIPPQVILVLSDLSAAEAGLDPGAVGVSRSGATTAPLTVMYTIGGTATPGSDYAALGGSLSLAAGQTSATISVNPIDDTDFEAEETVVVALTANPAYAVGAPSEATVIIASDDLQQATPVVLSVARVVDEKNGKIYLAGGPDGSEPLDDLNSQAEEYKLEIQGGEDSGWQAEYQDADPTLGDPTQVAVMIDYRSEEGWQGAFRVEYRVGVTVLKSADLPVDSSQDEATGKGQKGQFTWDLSAEVQTIYSLNNGHVRFINLTTNGKKIWASYSVTEATLGGGVPAQDDSPPTVPLGLTATAVSQSRIDLAWQDAADPQSGVASYRVYRDGTHVATVSGSSSDFSDTGLSSRTLFSYQVSAVNGVDLEGALSATAAATTLNAPPVAADDSITVLEGGTETVNAVANDSDPEGDPLIINGLNQGAVGATTTDGTNISYTHDGSESLNDAFLYRVSDGQGGTDLATVVVTVTPVNDAPLANDDSAVTAAGNAVIINVLANDEDLDSSTLTVTIATPPANGTASVNADNSVTYTPPTAFSGTATFTYIVSDGQLDSNQATVSIDIGLAQTITLAVTNGWDQKNEKTLSADSKLYVVQNSDNDWWETLAGYFTSFEFGGAVPANATVTSVKVSFEHWEEEGIDPAAIRWRVATGALANPSVIGTVTAPDRLGDSQEGVDSWEICDQPGVTCTAGLVNDLKIVIENMDTQGKKTLLDTIGLEVTFTP